MAIQLHVACPWHERQPSILSDRKFCIPLELLDSNLFQSPLNHHLTE